VGGKGPNWDEDLPWLGAWIPIAVVLALGAVVLSALGIPRWGVAIAVGLVGGGLFLLLWGPSGRLREKNDDASS
jgi:hypothetical protein